jgi:hypothetical protein
MYKYLSNELFYVSQEPDVASLSQNLMTPVSLNVWNSAQSLSFPDLSISQMLILR